MNRTNNSNAACIMSYGALTVEEFGAGREGDNNPERDGKYDTSVSSPPISLQSELERRLNERHISETRTLLNLIAELERQLKQVQMQRQVECPVCDYRSQHHRERVNLTHVHRFLRRAHTITVSFDSKFLAELHRLPAQATYWTLLGYDTPRFQRMLLSHAHRIERGELVVSDLVQSDAAAPHLRDEKTVEPPAWVAPELLENQRLESETLERSIVFQTKLHQFLHHAN